MTHPESVSTGQLGDELGCQSWRIARVFELGLVPEPPRVAGRRIIPRSLVPAIVAALRTRGWLGGHPQRSGRSRERASDRMRPASISIATSSS